MDMLLRNPNPKLRAVVEFLQFNQHSLEKRIAGGDPKIMDAPDMLRWKGHCEGELADAKFVVSKVWEILAL